MTVDLRAVSSTASVSVVVFLLLVITTKAFELDFASNVLVFGGKNVHAQSQFGASAILHRYENSSWAAFGAPQSVNENGAVTGSVFICKFGDRGASEMECMQKFPQVTSIISERTRANIEVLSANMSFGLAMGYDSENNRVSVCAPRTNMKLEMKDPITKELDTHYYTIGSCYVYHEQFNPFQTLREESDLTPESLNEIDKHKVAHYVNSMRELGFSIAVNRGKYVLGAPGYQDWSGKSVSYENVQDKWPVQTTPVQMSDNGDYAGYSVALIRIGKDKKEFVVHGAPRRNTIKGEVIICVPGSLPHSKNNIYLSGTQYGEYFGAAVSVADVNGDGYEDLLVGAPFYSPTESARDASGTVVDKLSKGVYDRGIVYLFYGRENGLEQHPKVLHPDPNSIGGRFGSTIANVGDLNKDGCDEIVVGAPFEARDQNANEWKRATGVVYLFMGSKKDGLSNENRQRIVPPATPIPVRGFGYSVSKGFDVTGNQYPDFAVGAVLSGHGFVYRSRPVILIDATISGNVSPIPQNGGTCQGRDRKDFFCFNMTLCASYDHPEMVKRSGLVPHNKTTFVDLRIIVDPSRSVARGFVADLTGRELASSASRKLKLEAAGVEKCIDVKAFVLPASHDGDILAPIEFRVIPSLVEDTFSGEFCPHCPILWSPKNASAQATYQVNCKHPGCVVTLQLLAHLQNFRNGSNIPLGRMNALNLKINVNSDASSDIAFRTAVEIRLRKGLKFNNPDKCTRLENRFDVVTCLVDNQLQAGSERDLQVKLQVDTDVGQDTDVGFEVILRTDSKDNNAKRNHLNFTYRLVNEADVGISGTGVVETVLVRTNTSDLKLDHIYTVTKYMESIVDRVNLIVNVPISRKADYLLNQPFIKFEKIEPKTSSDISHNCLPMPSSSGRLRRDFPAARSTRPHSASMILPTSTVRHLEINCVTFSCITYSCTFGPFNFDQSRASLHLRLLLNITDLIQQTNSIPEQITYRSDGNVVILDDRKFHFGEKERIKSTSIQTVLVREGRPVGEGVDWWWLLLAVIVGLSVVSIIFYVLYKCGFFKREALENLQELQKEPHSASPILGSPHHSPINNMVDVDDNDNNATFRDSKV